jgi:hypothetical protein
LIALSDVLQRPNFTTKLKIIITFLQIGTGLAFAVNIREALAVCGGVLMAECCSVAAILRGVHLQLQHRQPGLPPCCHQAVHVMCVLQDFIPWQSVGCVR